jgi:hypothetical protein
MSVATLQLTDSIQALVDARLDTIERMLLGRVSRADRLAILRDVETQIIEQLQERDADELTRDEVIEILRTLDPPEAYLPDGEGLPLVAQRPALGGRAAGLPAASSPARSGKRARRHGLGRLSGILGIVSLALVVAIPLVYILAIVTESEVMLFVGGLGVAALMFIGGVTSFVLALVARVSGAWAIVGLITGIFAVMFSLLPALYLLLALLAG